ncbi:MAG: uroporphyrinogen decarboxylase family protein [Phycisphaerae bacterium]|nr:uroporphyrinogen decarboxylase family protein [Phycisphaerae bacterium]
MKAINREETDRILTYDFMVSRELLARYGGFDESKKYAFEQIVEINAKAFKGMGLDATHQIYDPVKSWVRSKIENWGRFLGVNPDGWEVTRRGGADWITRRPFSNLKELEKNMPGIPKYEEVKKWYAPFIKHIKEVFDYYDLVFVGAVDGPVNDAYTYAGMELFMTAIYDAPELVSQIMDCAARFSAYIAQVFAENASAPMLFMGEDIACDTGPIFSPKFIIEQALPRWRWISEPIKEKGFKFLFHSDGRYGELLPIIFEQFGADGLEPIERKGCNDIFEIRRRYPDKLLFGNVCCAVTLPEGNIYDVEDETLELIEEIGPQGGILIGSSGEVGGMIPPENTVTMYETVHVYGTYPIDVEKIRKRRGEIGGELKTRKKRTKPQGA